jgi:hypothetical protein
MRIIISIFPFYSHGSGFFFTFQDHFFPKEINYDISRTSTFGCLLLLL